MSKSSLSLFLAQETWLLGRIYWWIHVRHEATEYRCLFSVTVKTEQRRGTGTPFLCPRKTTRPVECRGLPCRALCCHVTKSTHRFSVRAKKRSNRGSASLASEQTESAVASIRFCESRKAIPSWPLRPTLPQAKDNRCGIRRCRILHSYRY